MEIGVSTATFFGKELTEKSIELINKLDFKVCEIFLTTFSEFEEPFIKKLAQIKGDLRVHSVHSLTSVFEPLLYNYADRTREDAEVYYKKILRAGEMLNAKFYTFHGPSNLKKTKLSLNYERLGIRTKELTEIAKPYGVELSYENVHWAYYSEVGYFNKILQYAPSIKATLDIKQAMQANVDYRLLLNEMGDKLSTVHICDYDNDGNLKVPYQGVFDFYELFSNLSDRGYDGPILIELYARDYESYDEISKAYDKLNDTLYHATKKR